MNKCQYDIDDCINEGTEKCGKCYVNVNPSHYGRVGCPECGCEDGNHAQECSIYYNAGYGKRVGFDYRSI